MDKKVIRIKHLIEEIIKEHNEVWKDISANLKNCSYPKGYHCMTLQEKDIITIAAGLVRKGVK